RTRLLSAIRSAPAIHRCCDPSTSRSWQRGCSQRPCRSACAAAQDLHPSGQSALLGSGRSCCVRLPTIKTDLQVLPPVGLTNDLLAGQCVQNPDVELRERVQKLGFVCTQIIGNAVLVFVLCE